MKINVAIIMGGYSSENQISEKSGKVVFENLNNIFKCYNIYISRGEWYYRDSSNKKFKIDKDDFTIVNHPKIRFDCIFNAIHGDPGENGKIQSYFESLNIPITGSDSSQSEITFDKGIKVANSFTLNINDSFDINEIINQVGLPCFVKASNSGSSFGVYKAYKKSDLVDSIKKAKKYDDNILIETFIKGREFSVGVVKYDNQIVVLPITEIITSNDFFDYQAKYEGKSKEITPANLENNLKIKLKETAKKIYKNLKIKGLSRSEFILKDNEFYFLEINTVPGLSKESILPQQSIEAGIPIDKLFASTIYEAMDNIN
jgi:D-alanine-D-alanine ligase